MDLAIHSEWNQYVMHEIIKYKLETLNAMSSNSRSIDIYIELKYTYTRHAPQPHKLEHTFIYF